MTPKLIAFDLDGTVWTPDMYQLWGGGSPFTKVDGANYLHDCRGKKVKLLGIIDQILHELHTDDLWTSNDTKVAWVSCTDEPDWADECLRKFSTTGGIPLLNIAHSSQIYKANKQVHFQKLKKEYQSEDIDFSDMLFFDNEYYHIETVSKLGVKCVYCPNGMTEKVWKEGLNLF